MNQFKNLFLGKEKREYLRATTSQKCVRAGGKHNDFENVGKTTRHHTFFEMLGNFSFGDYFKSEAIPLAWDLVTQKYGLNPDQLFITVYKDDDAAYGIWNMQIGIPKDRIFRLGKNDNFWTMGETGPCGPCSEIHFDQGPGRSEQGHTDCLFPCECGRYVEIWNLVFMEFDRQKSGQLVPLPKPSVDTGMGLERMTAVLQGKKSNYETDLLKPLILYASEIARRDYGNNPDTDVSIRVISDHARAATFLISDGVVPSNDGRGYVLRKILRRGIRHGKLIGIEGDFLYRMTDLVVNLMQESYPELAFSQEYVAKIVKNEEHRFSSTLRIALDQLSEALTRIQSSANGTPILPGDVMFKFYDTYGLPLDLMQEIANEKQFELDEASFNKKLVEQKERGRASWIKSQSQSPPRKKRIPPSQQVLKMTGSITKVDFELPFERTFFLGYDMLEVEDTKLLAIYSEDTEVTMLTAGQEGEIYLDKTPFYAEVGGQLGDEGILEGTHSESIVQNTYLTLPGYSAHQVKCIRGSLQVGDVVRARVDAVRRDSIAKNHTATHLLHASLRQVVGFHVKQSGSLVAPDRLRFDFTHFSGLSDQEIFEIEHLINQKVMKNLLVTTSVKDLNQAVSEGAIALFDEKYGDQVRVVSVDSFSQELCGGTHVSRTGDIGLFKVMSEGGIAAGIRRIEAVTGTGALQRFRDDEELLRKLENISKTDRPNLIESIGKYQVRIRALEKTLEEMRYRLAKTQVQQLLKTTHRIKDVKVLTAVVNQLDKGSLRNLADELKSQIGRGVVVLATSDVEKVALVVAVTSDLTPQLHAGKMVKEIAAVVGGNGGGRPDMAEAGGKHPTKISLALETVTSYVEKTMKDLN